MLLRHWRLCALSLPAADREGGSARRAGSQRRLSALCLSEGKCSHPNGSEFSSHTPCTPSPKLKTLPWRGGAGGRARTSSDRSGRRRLRRGSDLIRGAGLHGGLQPGGDFLPAADLSGHGALSCCRSNGFDAFLMPLPSNMSPLLALRISLSFACVRKFSRFQLASTPCKNPFAACKLDFLHLCE